jgi:hypothetical protein
MATRGISPKSSGKSAGFPGQFPQKGACFLFKWIKDVFSLLSLSFSFFL